jgi:hypothetical protein
MTDVGGAAMDQVHDVPVKDDFPGDFYHELGRLAVEFGRLEYLIMLWAKDLIGKGFTQGMIEAAQESKGFCGLCDATNKRARARLTSQETDAFSPRLKRAKELAVLRNDVVHG